MTKLGENQIAESGLAPFFRLANADEVTVDAPENCKGDALHTWVRSLIGFQKEAHVQPAKTDDTWRLIRVEGAYLNDHVAAPCPMVFLSTRMVASYMNGISTLARKQGVEIRKQKLIQFYFFTKKGSMPNRTMVGGAKTVKLKCEIDCDLDDTTPGRILTNAVHPSPLNGRMRGRLKSQFKLGKNGAKVTTNKVPDLSGFLFPDPESQFSKSVPEVGDLTLMEPIGPTAKKDVVMGTFPAGSTFFDGQDRRLDIGAVGILRYDGYKEIQQMQSSPCGTSFRFLSSEDCQAPDDNTLISVGIGFCFATQFWSFVSMLKFDLPDHCIVQDAHFSSGGASGGTSKAEQADPVETHVYLETSESDETAQEILDFSEQTCFLHAFCRIGLKTRIKVVRA